MKNNIAQVLAHFADVDPTLHAIMAPRTKAFELLQPTTQTNSFFARLCQSIISQQLAGKAADAIIARFEALFPDGNITPTNVWALPEETYRNVGASWAKARYLRDAALQTLEGTVRFEDFEKLDDEAIIAELTKIKGVGRWTAEMFLIFTLGREDVFSFGDLGLKKAFQRIYTIDDDKQMLAAMEKITPLWSPYRSYASVVLWDYLDNR